jgi:hypothetical protein
VEQLPISDDCYGYRYYMDRPVVNSMLCDSVDRCELLELISEWNPNKSCGPDSIHPEIVRVVESSAYILNL